MTTSISARFEFRLRADAKRRIEQAAELLRESASDFARTAAEERADRVLREHMLTTVVPAEFFDDLLRALDAPPEPNEALKAAARRAHNIVEQR
jgi:uncharacterized protein (DUF1778 family)